MVNKVKDFSCKENEIGYNETLDETLDEMMLRLDPDDDSERERDEDLSSHHEQGDR